MEVSQMKMTRTARRKQRVAANAREPKAAKIPTRSSAVNEHIAHCLPSKGTLICERFMCYIL